MIRSSILVLVIFLFLLSCAKLPGSGMDDEVKPELAANWNEIENDDIIKKNHKALSKIHYREFFKNKEVVNLVENAIVNNKDLRIALLNVESAFNYYGVTRADSMPKISAGADVSRQKVSKNSLGRFGTTNPNAKSFIINNYEANLASLSFELDLFGKLKYTNEAAFNDFLSRVENQNSVRISLIAQAANSYIQWLADLKLLKIAKERLDLEKESYKLVKESQKTGYASRADLLEARNALNLAKSEYAFVRETAKKDKNIVVMILGAENDANIKAIDFDKVKLNNEFYVDLSSEILLLRPDVVVAEYQLKSQEANIEVARASFFPSISLTGSYGFMSNKFRSLVSRSNSGAWDIGMGIDIPIFSGFKNDANLAMQKVEREIAIEDYQKTIQNAFKEVNDGLVSREALKVDLESKNKIRESNGEIYVFDKESFNLGTKNKIDLINSRRQYLLAKSEAITSKKKSLINQIELYKALGGGFVDSDSLLTPKAF